jgi:4-amino-4-deoxy-L-arabinose transferase-like glycosyltransferase
MLLVVGAFVRLDGLTARQLGHMEIFTPGIDYAPWELSIPHPRLTLWQTLKGSTAEPHPPVWYLAMFPWTKVLGSSLFTIRVPSVLFGLASIVLVYLLARQQREGFAALLAPALLALNGHHVYWSQIARPYMLASCLGLLATCLLLRLVARPQRAGLLLWAYLGVVLVGLETNYYFWILFGTHILWLLVRSSENDALLLGLARAALALLILASPTVSLAVYQAYRPSYLPAVEASGLLEFLGFGFLYETSNRAQVPFPLPAAVTGAILPGVAVALLALGIGTGRPEPVGKSHDGTGLWIPTRRQLVFVTVLATLGCVGAWYAGAAGFIPDFAATQAPRVVKAIPIPLVLLLMTLGLERYRGLVLQLSRRVQATPVLGPVLRSLVASLAIVPVAIVTVISLVAISFYALQHLLLFTPYLLIVLAAGIGAVARLRPRWAAVAGATALGVLLAAAHWGGIVYHQHLPTARTDYRGLAARWLPELDPSDLIFVRKDWRTTPLFYYVGGRRHRYVGRDYAEEVRTHPAARIWVVRFDDLAPSDAAREALATYEPARTIAADDIAVELYVPSRAGSAPGIRRP